jgi:hypothetical protein
LWRAIAAYVGFPLISLVVAIYGLQIQSVAQVMETPLQNYHDGDTLLILPMIKDVVEHGTHWHNDRMGAPGTFQMYDFPVIDHLHFACLWVIGQVTGSYLAAFNVYFLLSYPLVTLTMLAVLRRYGLSYLAAGTAGVIFAFLYYHATRGQAHYFLSQYWLIPPSMMMILQVCRGEPPLTEKREDGSLQWAIWRWNSLGYIILAILSALGGAYYAFFTCSLLAFATVYGAILAWSWKPAAVGVVLLAITTASGVAAHAPTIMYQAKHGPNPTPTRRLARECEMYGLKLAHLFMPQIDHQSLTLGTITNGLHNDGREIDTESRFAALGFITSAGVLGLGVAFMLPNSRRWPYGPLGALVVFSILLATVGGFGSLLNYFVSSQIRAYSRISIFIAFCGLFATFYTLDRYLPAAGVIRCLVFAALGVFGVWDGCPKPYFDPYMAAKREVLIAQYASDRAFFAEVEAKISGGMVFCVPHLPYPEGPVPYQISSAYAFSTGYLHTQTVRWSFGAMKERKLNDELTELSHIPVPLMPQVLAEKGFDAICFDTRAFSEEDAKRFGGELTGACGPPIAKQSDGSRLLFDLRPLRGRMAK